MLICLVAVVLASTSAAFAIFGRSLWVPIVQQINGRQTLSDVLSVAGPAARARLKPYFDQEGVNYPGQQITLLAVKDTATVELWVGPVSAPVFIRQYRILAASGVAGPKLREGDKQVPEGSYKVTGLNPNSSFHLSMKLNYPNAFDLKHATAEGRKKPGSDIFIHGKARSVGCLAMGDEAIEELFVLAVDTGIEQWSVVIAPTDPREGPLIVTNEARWVRDLYTAIAQQFSTYQTQK